MIAARIVAGAVGAVTAVLLPRALGPETYGQYGIAMGFAALAVVISDLGITTSLARYISDSSVSKATLVRMVIWRLVSAVAAAALLAGYGLCVQFGWGVSNNSSADMVPAFLYLSAALIVGNSLVGVAYGLLPSYRMIRVQSALMIVQPLIELAGITAVLLLALDAAGIIVASTVASLVVGVVGMALVIARTKGEAHGATIRTIAHYSAPMFIVAICFSVFGQIDQFVIWWFHGSETAAPYIASWRMIALMHLPGLAVATVVAPRLAGGGDYRRTLYTRWLAALAIIYGGFSIITAAVAPVMIPMLLGSKWLDTVAVFQSLTLYAFLLGIAPLATMAANFLGGARKRVRLSVVTIVLNITLDVLLIPKHGVTGAAISTSIAFSWYVLAHAYLSFQLLGGALPQTASEWWNSTVRSWSTVASALWVIGSVTVTGFLTLALSQMIATRAPELVAVLAATAVGAVVYALSVWSMWRAVGRPNLSLRHEPPAIAEAVPATEAGQKGAA